MNNDRILAAAELRRRLELGQVSHTLFDWAFPKQRAFLEDRSRFKALFCPRRSAKTFTAGLDLVEGARRDPKFNGLFAGMTFDSVRSTFWIPVVCELWDRLGWPQDALNHSRLEAVAPSGGRFRCVGADATPREMKKILGGKYDRIHLDEVAAWKNDVRGMVDKDLRPTLTDKLGTLCLDSTPSDLTKGLFYDITTGKEPGWSVHRWHPLDNPHVAKQWEIDHAALIAGNPLIVNTPAYKQMWQGEWCVDSDALVYKFSPYRNVTERLPDGRWTYVMGVDLGWDDPTAFVVLAYGDFSPTTYVVHAECEQHLDFTATAQRIRHLQAKWGIDVVVIDGASAQGVEEMIARHGLSLMRAEKQGKYDSQKLLSSDLLSERLFLLRGPTKGLQDELAQLIWDPNALARVPPKWVEHPRLPNHQADAMLYAWRYCYAHVARPAHEAPALPQPGNEEHERMFQHALFRAKRQEARDSLDPEAMNIEEPDVSGVSDVYDDGTSGLW